MLTYEQYNRAIGYKEDEALWRKDHSPFWLEMYHTAGAFYAFPIEIFVVDAGVAAKVYYSPKFFDFNGPAKAPVSPAQSDFAGFHVLAQIDKLGVFRDFLVFLRGKQFSGDCNRTGFWSIRSRLGNQYRPARR